MWSNAFMEEHFSPPSDLRQRPETKTWKLNQLILISDNQKTNTDIIFTMPTFNYRVVDKNAVSITELKTIPSYFL